MLLDPHRFPVNLGWRLGFGVGALIGLVIIFLRHAVPESPRWLLTHGHPDQAEHIVSEIEQEIDPTGALPQADWQITIRPNVRIGFGSVVATILRTYPKRTVLCLALVISQAFLYNGVAFSFGLILRNFYQVPVDRVGLYLLPFALTNFLGPLVLGRLFDTVGRKPMIAGTLALSACLLALSGFLFAGGQLSAGTQTALWAAIFFFASAAASAAYLTVSEVFPLEMRGLVIALFYSVGTAAGGPLASWLFGRLIDTGSRRMLCLGDLLAAGLLLATSGVVLAFGVRSERAALEQIARPLSAAEDEQG